MTSSETPSNTPKNGDDPHKDSLIEYPSDFPIKVMGLNQDGFVHTVTTIAKQFDPFFDASKIERELGWKPEETFETGLRKTVAWYLNNREWWKRVLNGEYQLGRLGEKA